MNLREVLKNLDSNLKKDFIKRINECPDANYFAQDNNTKYSKFYGYMKYNIEFDEGNWCTDDDFWFIDEIPLADDHDITILTRNEVLGLLKEEEYTLNNLPEKWFVEYSDDIDEELLAIKLGGGIGGQYKYYGVGKIYYCCNDLKSFYDHTNVTHLFLKKKEETKMQEKEIIEIDGRKFRLVPEQANFKNCDLVMKGGKKYEFIGYYEADVILRECVKGELSQHENVGIFKLEEVKTKVWHYAIYKKSPHHGSFAHSYFYETEEILKRYHPVALEYRTFEEQL